MQKTTVWKFTLNVADETTLRIPEGSELLLVGTQAGNIALWFRVNPEARVEEVTYQVRGTGHDCRRCGRHLGSVLLHGGALVFHVFTTAVGE